VGDGGAEDDLIFFDRKELRGDVCFRGDVAGRCEVGGGCEVGGITVGWGVGDGRASIFAAGEEVKPSKLVMNSVTEGIVNEETEEAEGAGASEGIVNEETEEAEDPKEAEEEEEEEDMDEENGDEDDSSFLPLLFIEDGTDEGAWRAAGTGGADDARGAAGTGGTGGARTASENLTNDCG
jgi:hypothetical protein